MVSERFTLAALQYRARGGRLYRLAYAHGMTPSALSATLSGARRADDDEHIVKIGATLGLKPEECFEDEDSAVAS